MTILDAASGLKLASWTTSAPANTSKQYAIADIEHAAVPPISGAARPNAYTLYIDAGSDTDASATKLQSVIWSSDTGYFENVSGCGVVADMHSVGNVHSSVIAEYPSTLYVFNDSSAARSLSAEVYDAITGADIGTYSLAAAVAGFGTATIPESNIETYLHWTPLPTQNHLNIRVTLRAADGTTDAPYRVKHLVQDGDSGAVSDMTDFCSSIDYGG